MEYSSTTGEKLELIQILHWNDTTDRFAMASSVGMGMC